MKIIRVEPAVPVVSMNWMIGSRCNYACSYCPPELHDDTSPHPDLDRLKLVWQNFYTKTQHIGLPYKISFTGGEVTANKSFLPLIEFLQQSNHDIKQLIVSTNGSASTAYYLRLAKLVHAISFSTHSEFWNEHKFFDTVIAVNQVMIRPEKSCHVNIMDEPWDRQNFARYQELLDQHNISYSINKINLNLV
jgi:MoaA/NifB/PqqE/SkfB family radical SAM enzyme